MQIKEMPYIEAIDLKTENKKEVVKKLFSVCAGLTEEEINSLTIAEGQIFDKAIAEVNGFVFQKPTEVKE